MEAARHAHGTPRTGCPARSPVGVHEDVRPSFNRARHLPFASLVSVLALRAGVASRAAAAAALYLLLAFPSTGVAATSTSASTAWEAESPVRPLPAAPLGLKVSFAHVRGLTITPEKVRLGRWLFFDPRLSKDGTVSCASCHRPEHGFSEPTARSRGVGGQEGSRKAPPILNAAFSILEAYFWDGRAGSLAEQAKGPMVNPIEMGNSHAEVVRTVNAIPGYRRAFRAAYGDGRLDIDRVADAIAAYEATRLSGDSRYDRFEAGDANALTDLEREGRAVFFGRGRCDTCHPGPHFTDSGFHNVGIGWKAPAPGRPDRQGLADPGRFAVTGKEKDLGSFKSPTLRDVTKRAPYMHDGSAQTLRDAVRAYQFPQENPWLDPLMREVDINCHDVDALVAFLGALEGTGYEDAPPSHLPQ